MESISYSLAASEINERPWAILPEKLAAMKLALASGIAGKLSAEHGRFGAGRGGSSSFLSSGSVAVLPIYGLISHRETWLSRIFGGTSTQQFAAALRQALADSSVSGIILDVDSPGGTVDAVPELSAEIYKARGKKRIVAVANAMAASAAYWIASAADELVVTPSGSVGSIGIVSEHEDMSKALEAAGVKITLIRAGKYKTEGNPFEPLGDQARAAWQADVDHFGAMFTNDVARNRGVGSYSVNTGFGEGRMILAADAVKRGMADRVATFDQTLARLMGSKAGKTEKAFSAQLARRRRELKLYVN